MTENNLKASGNYKIFTPEKTAFSVPTPFKNKYHETAMIDDADNDLISFEWSSSKDRSQL